jgi:hypothetical protein
MEIKSLIERIEKSEGAAFALDKEIHLAIHGMAANGQIPPAYTAQIERALALLPEGAAWAVTNCKGGIPENADFSASSAAISVNGGEYRANAATPALALCAAALKARNPSHEG